MVLGVVRVVSTVFVPPTSHETHEARRTVATTRRRSPGASFPVGQISLPRTATGTRCPRESRTTTPWMSSPIGAVLMPASACGADSIAAAGHSTRTAASPATARRTIATSASAGPRRELRRRRRVGYCVWDTLGVDTVAQMVPGREE